MALVKQHATRFGITLATAYCRILRLSAYREDVTADDGTVSSRVAAEITTGIWKDAAAARDGSLPIDQTLSNALVDPDAEAPLVKQAYELLKTTPEYENAEDA